MLSLRSMATASLEADATGTSQELEYTFYGRLQNVEDLAKAASKERQLQWSIFSQNPAKKGQIRNRRITEGDGVQYTQTTKYEVGTEAGQEESTIEIPAEQFKAFGHICETGMHKDRFKFPVPDSELVWEIDMFIKSDGSYGDVCKIDLEVPNADTPIPDLPLDFELFIRNQKGQRTEAEIAVIDQAFTDYITIAPGSVE